MKLHQFIASSRPIGKANHRWIEFGSSILNDIAGFYSAADDGFEQKRRSLIDKFVWLKQS